MQKIISSVIAVLVTISTFFTSLFGVSLPLSKYDVYKNLRYGEFDAQILDVYVPKTAAQNEHNGCILFIHGGSWIGGDKKELKKDCTALAEKGYITATMNYTLYTEQNKDTFTIDIMLDDIVMAISRLKAFSDEKALNITRLATSGYSAGGHISMLYSYTRADDAAIKPVFTANRVGPAIFSEEAWGDMGYGLASIFTHTEITEEMIADGRAAEIARSVSPACYVNAGTLPSLFAYGGKDVIVNIANGEALAEAFRKAGAPHDYIIFPDSNHDLGSNPEQTAAYNAKLLAYCEEYFGY